MANFTPQEIEEMLKEFFDVVGKRQYIGARYVPIFGRKGEGTIEWNNSAPYEPLTIVLYQGNSYTSRQYVPVGVDLDDTNFWAKTGDYNAQIEQYRQDVSNLGALLPPNAFDENNTVKDSIDAISDVLPISDFDSTNTVKEAINAISDVLPTSDFDSINTVKSAIDNVANVIPISEYDDTHTINDAISDMENALPNNWCLSEDDVIKLGTLTITIEGESFVPQSICFADNYLYVGYASSNRVDSYLARVNLSTLEILSYVKCPYYCHFNCLSLYNDEFYSISPETTTINDVTGAYVFVFDKYTLNLKRTVFVDSTARSSNLIIGPNNAKTGTPIVQAYIDAMDRFVDYGYFEHDSHTILQSISCCEYNRYGRTIADGCVLRVNRSSGNLRNYFAYINTRIDRNANNRRNNSIILVQPNALVLGEVILPNSINNVELEGITTDDTYIYFNAVNGDLYRFSLSTFMQYTAIINFVNPMYPVLPINDADYYAIFNNGYIPRRFAASDFGYLNYTDFVPNFGTVRGEISTNVSPDGDINVAGIVQYAASTIGFVRMVYVKTNPLTSNCNVYELNEMRSFNMGNEISGSSANADNIRNLTDSELITWLESRATEDYHCRFKINGRNSATQVSNYLLMKDVIV